MKKVMVIMICIVGVSLSGIIWGETRLSQEKTERVLGPEAEPEQEGLQVKEFALCEGIRERKPVKEKTIFPSGVGKVYLWTDIYGAEEPTTVTHVWYYEGEKIAAVPLEIKYSRTRTWSYKTISPEWLGDWQVEVVDLQGNLLKKVTFVIGTPAEIKAKEKVAGKKEAPLFPKAKSETGLKVEVKLGTNVEEREIRGETEHFPTNVGRVYCWSLVMGAEEPTTITHIWYYGKKKMTEVPLSVKYPRTRTWSYKTILPEQVGDWYVEVVDISGNPLKKVSFKIGPK